LFTFSRHVSTKFFSQKINSTFFEDFWPLLPFKAHFHDFVSFLDPFLCIPPTFSLILIILSSIYHFGFNSKSAEPKSIKIPLCPLCKAKHKLFQCDDFKALTTNKHYYATRDAGCCYHCLGPNHSAKDCTWHRDVKCGLESCTRYHHPLLHNFKAQMLMTFEEFVGAGVPSLNIQQVSTLEKMIMCQSGLRQFC